MKKRGFFMMIFFGMGSFFSGCGFHQNDVDLSVEEFERRINQDKVQLVDVRTPEEYASEHIPNAISINILSEEFDSLSTQILNPEYPVLSIVVPAKGLPWRQKGCLPKTMLFIN